MYHLFNFRAMKNQTLIKISQKSFVEQQNLNTKLLCNYFTKGLMFWIKPQIIL